MQLTWDIIQENAIVFSRKWSDAKNEEAEAQGFEIDFLRVFGVDEPMSVGNFEYKVSLSSGKTGYIDYVWKGKIAIEMKSRGKDLNLAFAQLQNYMQHMPGDDIPDLWLVCDFENMRLNRRSTNEVWNFKTKDLRKHASLYHFGVLTSNVHMAWMRTIEARLKSDYTYSKDIVYNNFPWPDADNAQRAEIEKLAQVVLDVRLAFPGSSLACLYDPLTMPPELLKAHRNLDRAVMKLYGFTPQNTPTEADCVAKLMEQYQALTDKA